MRILTAALLLLGVFACDDSPPTQLLVRFAAGPSMSAMAGSLRVRVFVADGSAVYDETRSIDEDPILVLPATVPLVPREGSDGRAFRVEGTLMAASGVQLGLQTAEVAFAEGGLREVWLCFDDRCTAVSCEASERCVAGSCATAAMEPRPVGEVDGVAACGALPLTDAGAIDAGDDDAGVDAGPPCDCPCASDTCDSGPCRPSTVITSIAAGDDHACAVDATGQLRCWGSNSNGQLGLGDLVLRRAPELVEIPTGAISVSAGGLHSCAVATDGSLWCWGDNDRAQLARERDVGVAVPERVGAGNDWQQVAAGGLHTCGLHVDGSLECWGDNRRGQLGIDQAWGLADFLADVSRNWSYVSAGAEHTCAIDSADPRVWCWGNYRDGRLGEADPELTEDQRAPNRSGGGSTQFATLSLGRAHTCGTTIDGTGRCWGLNTQGQAGQGTWQRPRFLVTISDDMDWVAVGAGGTHSCAIRDDAMVTASLWCFGTNTSGQLGLPDTMQENNAARVSDAEWTSVTAGGDFTCALQADGSLWCWGSNVAGQLALGDAANRDTPTRVCIP